MKQKHILIISILLSLSSCVKTGYTKIFEKVYYHYSYGEGGYKFFDFGADASSFKQDSWYEEFGTDCNYAYFRAKRIKESDGPSFKILDYWYQKDKNHVYYNQNIIEGADPLTFSSPNTDYDNNMQSSYAEDKNDFYYKDKSLHVVNKKGFKQFFYGFDQLWGIDGNHYYYQEKRCNIADPKSFIILDGIYAKDKLKVYYKNTILEGADASSFKTTSIFKGEDKYSKYNMGKKTFNKTQ